MKLRDQMKYHEMQAFWWTSCANNGHYKVRVGKVFDGHGDERSDEDLKNSAMQTAGRHMQFFMECAETLQEQEI